MNRRLNTHMTEERSSGRVSRWPTTSPGAAPALHPRRSPRRRELRLARLDCADRGVGVAVCAASGSATMRSTTPAPGGPKRLFALPRRLSGLVGGAPKNGRAAFGRDTEYTHVQTSRPDWRRRCATAPPAPPSPTSAAMIGTRRRGTVQSNGQSLPPAALFRLDPGKAPRVTKGRSADRTVGELHQADACDSPRASPCRNVAQPDACRPPFRGR